MTNNLKLVSCLTYSKELQVTLKQLNAGNVDIAMLPSTCCSLKNKDILAISQYIQVLEDGTSDVCILMPYLCTGYSGDRSKMKKCCFYDISNCHDLIAPKDLLEHFIAKNYYILTPGWVEQWKYFVIDRWKFNKKTAMGFFQESAKEILVIDTGIYDNFSGKLQEFCDFIDMPFSILPIGMDFYKLHIQGILNSYKIREFELEGKDHKKETSRKISELSMIFDIIPTLSGITSEEEIISRTMNLFQVLFAPGHIVFVQIMKDNSKKAISSLGKDYGRDSIEKLLNFSQEYLIHQDKNGFIIKIGYDSQVFGYIILENIMFPQYLDHYLNLSLILKSFIGLVISNARHYREVENAKSHAELSVQAKSKFLASMSHEIRTPLSAIIGFTELLIKTPMDSTQQQYAKSINISGQALLGIINNILDLSKIEAKKLELEMIRTDILEFVKETIDIVKYNAEKKGLNLFFTLSPGMPAYVEIDPIRLRQILVNLSSNAIKFTEKGEVEIQVEFQAINFQKGRYKFSVRDTGIGIQEDQKQNLFKAFSQADKSISRKFGGTGLGLVISNFLAEQMGGKIEFQSESGKGSTFYFSIETAYYQDQDKETKAINQISQKISTSKLKVPLSILIAEDVPTNMMLIKAMICKLLPQAKIIEAKNGWEALQFFQNQKPDIVFMDVQMPEMDGLTATRKIREYENRSNGHVPIIALTADALQDGKEKCIASGMDDVLTKPIKISDIITIVEKYLKHFEERL